MSEHDVIVIGGGAAGSTAALVLARARWDVALVDDHSYRNATVRRFHGFPGRDATHPSAFRHQARQELAGYGVTSINTPVANASHDVEGIRLGLADGRAVSAAAIVLATGVHDELPAIDGLREQWGTSAFNCPFCDGWEHRDQPVVVIDAAPGADHLADMLRSWTPHVTVLAATDIRRVRDERTGGRRGAELVDGSFVPASAFFVRCPARPRNAIAVQLGCAVDGDGYVITDATGATSQPLVWAAGDLRRPPPAPHQVVLAAGDGSAAAIAVHRTLTARGVRPIASRGVGAGVGTA